VWVDLNVSETHSELNLLGVPLGWKWFATRGYDERPEALIREHARACAHAAAREPMRERFPPPILLVYGGGPTIAELVKSLPGAIHFPERTGPRHYVRKSWPKAQADAAGRTA
jgi:hypothetical protein